MGIFHKKAGNKKKPIEGKHPFSSDRPIQSRKEDRLGRWPFAEAVAKAVEGWTGNDSLVVALYGAWGCGKSSIKNMVLEALKETSEDNKPDIVEFNPWQFSGHDRLSEAFFLEVGLALGRAGKSKKEKHLSAKWREYAAKLRLGGLLFSGLIGVWPIILLIAGIAGLGESLPDKGFSRFLFLISMMAILAFAGLLQWSATFSQYLSEWLKAKAERTQKTLSELKKELYDLLRSRNRVLLVVMDDVDRLTAKETQILFQLVKSNGDLPHLVYLLLFQREVIEKSLEEVIPVSGREFLEKIVQIGFDVPIIERGKMERILFEGLDELLGKEGVAIRFSQQRWGNIFIPGLSPYFKSLRDVHRFLSTLKFHVGLFRQGRSFEVNPVDLIALEVLRLFEPDIYHQIPKLKRILTEKHESHSLLGVKEDEARKVVESLVNRASQDHKTCVSEILQELFPHIAFVFGGSHYDESFEDEWFRDLRVCSKNAFDRYFHFDTPEGDISQAELDRIFSLVNDREGLVSEFRALHERGLLVIALDRLESYKEKIDLKHIEALITALFDIGDDLPESTTFYDIGSDMHAIRIIFWSLRREKDQQRKEQIVENAVKGTVGLYLPVKQISLEVDKETRTGDPRNKLIGDEKVQIFKEMCLEKIHAAAANGRLATHPRFLFLLYRWWEFGNPEEPKGWARNLMKGTNGLLRLLKGFLQKSTSTGMGEYISRINWYISYKRLENFVPIEEIEQEVKKLKLDTLSEEDRRTVRAFNRALKRKREGKSDDAPPWMDDSDNEESSL